MDLNGRKKKTARNTWLSMFKDYDPIALGYQRNLRFVMKYYFDISLDSENYIKYCLNSWQHVNANFELRFSSKTTVLNILYFRTSNIWSTQLRSTNGFEGKILEFTYGKTMNLHADSYDVKEYEKIRDFARQSPSVPIESKAPALPKSRRAHQVKHVH